MRHVSLVLFAVGFTVGPAVAGLAGPAFAAPFEPAKVPDQVAAVGHLDVDALRRTQIFATAGGQAAIDAALGDAPPALRPVVQSLSRSVHGVSFWRDTDQGAIYLDTG